jgi:hypothetical protein
MVVKALSAESLSAVAVDREIAHNGRERAQTVRFVNEPLC